MASLLFYINIILAKSSFEREFYFFLLFIIFGTFVKNFIYSELNIQIIFFNFIRIIKMLFLFSEKYITRQLFFHFK